MCLKSPLIIIVFICLFFSCEEKTKLNFEEIAITSNNNTIVEIYIPKAIGNTTVSEKINNKINDLIIATLRIGDSDTITATTVEESVANFNSEYQTFKTEFPESPVKWESQIDGEVMYHSDDIISIAITNYQNTGGAHGILIISFLNFDAQTGLELKNTDLFNDASTFETIAQKYFNDKVSGKEDLYFEPDNFVLPTNIGFSEDGLILLYNTYEIAPYSSGITEFRIPYDNVSNLLNHL